MIKTEILEKINNSQDCFAIAMNVVGQGYSATETSVKTAIKKGLKILSSPHYIKAICEVTGLVKEDVVIELTTTTA